MCKFWTVDVPVPRMAEQHVRGRTEHIVQVLEEIAEVVRLVPQRVVRNRITKRLFEQIVEIPFPHVVEQLVNVPKISRPNRFLPAPQVFEASEEAGVEEFSRGGHARFEVLFEGLHVASVRDGKTAGGPVCTCWATCVPGVSSVKVAEKTFGLSEVVASRRLSTRVACRRGKSCKAGADSARKRARAAKSCGTGTAAVLSPS